MTGLDVGLLVLRLGFAALLFGHATQKLFGWFRGGGPAGAGAMFETWGFRPGPTLAVVAGTCELVGAASVAFGFLTVGGCAVLIGTMIVASSPAARNGLWAHLGGNEVPVVYAFLAVVLAFTGPAERRSALPNPPQTKRSRHESGPDRGRQRRPTRGIPQRDRAHHGERRRRRGSRRPRHR
jgi:putative oxidoreductase